LGYGHGVAFGRLPEPRYDPQRGDGGNGDGQRTQ
jgi:hypothetical protein